MRDADGDDYGDVMPPTMAIASGSDCVDSASANWLYMEFHGTVANTSLVAGRIHPMAAENEDIDGCTFDYDLDGYGATVVPMAPPGYPVGLEWIQPGGDSNDFNNGVN